MEILNINALNYDKKFIDPLLKKGLSDDYLSFLFKKNLGVNLSRYIRSQRLQSSKEMLKGNYTISDIAYYLGFCSESYFISCFKKEFGKTPKKFRNQL